MDGTIAQTYISAVHSFETRILRFRIEHLRASLLLEPEQEGAADLRARLQTLESPRGTGAAPGGGR